MLLTDNEVAELARRMENEGVNALASDLRCATDQDTQREVLRAAADQIEREGRYDDPHAKNTVLALREAADELRREDDR